jgi:serine/threonine-protein kinase
MNVTSPSVVSGMLLAGKYRVDRLLGEGGMGVVVAATNEALRQRVAIKLLRSGALANQKALGRFEREARAAASLRSEHVARVLDVGKLEDGRPYMVMEYLEGRDLGDVIDNGPPTPVGDVIDYVLQACEAIAEAHAAGIVHRDLKPKNLFLATSVDGRPLVKVLDFGISKMEDAEEDMSLTRTTEIIGSPSYMSPEQLHASKEVDVRTDVWALGVILYELLTKKVPFMAMTVTQLVAVVLTEPTPDVRVIRPDVPEGLALAIKMCLAKKREERFPSIHALVQAIASFGTGQQASMVERISRVAQGSGRLPPTTSSGPYAAINAAQLASAALTAGMPNSDPTGPPDPRIGSGSGSGIPPATPSGMPVSNPNSKPPTSSARLAIHGGTSVAWGETQVDNPNVKGAAPRRSKAPFVFAGVSLFIVLAGAATGGVYYVKRARATQNTGVEQPPPATSENPPAPYGRHDLEPIGSTTTPAPPPSAVEMPSALPPTRVPTSEGRGDRPRGNRLPKPGTPNTAVVVPTPPPGPATTPPVQPPKPNGNDLENIGRR